MNNSLEDLVVICLKTTTFAVSATTIIYIILITNTIYRYCKNKKVILQNKIPLAKGGIFVFYQLKIRTVPAADREH